MKSDPRVRYTQMVIQNAFLELLQQKPFSKITVREICDKAEINRSTFYKHYQDCYDLLDKLKEEALARFDNLMTGIEAYGVEHAVLAVVQAMKNYAETFNLIAPEGGGGEFTRQVVRQCYRYLGVHLTVSPERGWNEEQKEMSYAFLTGGVGSVIECWMRSGCKEPPEQIAATIMELSGIVVDGLAGE